MPFFDLDFDLQIFETYVVDAPDFGEADPGDTEDSTDASAEDLTDILSLHSGKVQGGSIAFDDKDKDAFVFVASGAATGNTTGANGQQGPGPFVYGTPSSSTSSTSSAVG